MSTSPLRIICNPCTRPRGITASGKSRCSVCNQQVWVAPATIAVMKSPPPEGVAVFCTECGARAELRDLIEGRGPMEIAVTPQQETELLGAIGVTASEAWIEMGLDPSRIKRLKPNE